MTTHALRYRGYLVTVHPVHDLFGQSTMYRATIDRPLVSLGDYRAGGILKPTTQAAVAQARELIDLQLEDDRSMESAARQPAKPLNCYT